MIRQLKMTTCSSFPTNNIELTKALAEIEENLSGILEGIQKLNNESQQAKEEITEAFGRQLSHLHSRQTQLLRQVLMLTSNLLTLILP